MWSKDGKSFQPKLCDFSLLLGVPGSAKKTVIGEHKGYNFSPFVGHTGEEEVKIPFDGAKYADTYIVVKWDIQLTKEKKKEHERTRESILGSSAVQGGSTSVVGKGADLAEVVGNPEKIKEIIEKAMALEAENAELEKNVELYMKAKDSM